MRADDDALSLLNDGLLAIRTEYGVPEVLPAEVEQSARDVASRAPSISGRRDARDLAFVTLDPAGSTDLDQAFALAADGDDIVLSYAIADVGFFVDRGGVIEAEALRRGTTVYLPGMRVPQYPTVLSEHAASLLPDGDRPAVLLTVRVGTDGGAVLEGAERAVIRSRAKLAYETATAAELDPLLPEIVRRVVEAEDRRGASRIELPEQEVIADPSAPGGMRLVLRARNVCEDQNSALSLAANLAVAAAMVARRVGLFRVMREPDERELSALRHSASVLGIAWPAALDLHGLERTLDPSVATVAAFLLAARRAGGGATYAVLSTTDGPFTTTSPWHAAVAAPYAHATAPLRRLADRYVLDLICASFAGDDLPALPAGLAETMERMESLAAKVDRAAIDLVEAVTLSGRLGDVFDAAVIDASHDGAQVQLVDPPVRARVRLADAQPGQRVRLRLASVDLTDRQLTFVDDAAGRRGTGPPGTGSPGTGPHGDGSGASAQPGSVKRNSVAPASSSTSSP